MLKIIADPNFEDIHSYSSREVVPIWIVRVLFFKINHLFEGNVQKAHFQYIFLSSIAFSLAGIVLVLHVLHQRDLFTDLYNMAKFWAYFDLLINMQSSLSFPV